LQTLPDNYTQGLTETQRYNCIGNGWTVDIIVHILNHLKENDFKNKKRFVLKNDFNEKELLLNHFAQMKGLVF
jgi:site-specific DNA-cytosine methylase